MSALAMENWGTSVYATQGRKQRTAQTVNMSAFARLERIIPVTPQQHARVVQFLVGSQEIKLTIEGSTAVPSWVGPVINSMTERWGNYQGWDSYDAKPTDTKLAEKLLNYLSEIMPFDAVAPIITPLADGGLQAEWHRGNKDIEVVVPFGEPARYYYFDATTDAEEEEGLEEGNIETVRNHINNL
jgi:hypothetical protein